MFPRMYIVELLDDFDNIANDYKYRKGERRIVTESKHFELAYLLPERNMDVLPKDICKKIYELKIEEVEE